MGVSLGRLSGSALGSNLADLLMSELGVGGWQHRSALSQSRALFLCVQITLVYSEYPPCFLRSNCVQYSYCTVWVNKT